MELEKHPEALAHGKALFAAIDANGNGLLEPAEITVALEVLAESAAELALEEIADLGCEGRVGLDEWLVHMSGMLEILGARTFISACHGLVKKMHVAALPTPVREILEGNLAPLSEPDRQDAQIKAGVQWLQDALRVAHTDERTKALAKELLA